MHLAWFEIILDVRSFIIGSIAFLFLLYVHDKFSQQLQMFICTARLEYGLNGFREWHTAIINRKVGGDVGSDGEMMAGTEVSVPPSKFNRSEKNNACSFKVFTEILDTFALSSFSWSTLSASSFLCRSILRGCGHPDDRHC